MPRCGGDRLVADARLASQRRRSAELSRGGRRDLAAVGSPQLPNGPRLTWLTPLAAHNGWSKPLKRIHFPRLWGGDQPCDHRSISRLATSRSTSVQRTPWSTSAAPES